MTNNYIIFDMDGVLLDSEPMHQEIIYETFQLKGIPFDKAYIQTLTGMSA
ncbi:MAG: HAD family hydrolase, partial [Capnocytophaga ochracea]